MRKCAGVRPSSSFGFVEREIIGCEFRIPSFFVGNVMKTIR